MSVSRVLASDLLNLHSQSRGQLRRHDILWLWLRGERELYRYLLLLLLY